MSLMDEIIKVPKHVDVVKIKVVSTHKFDTININDNEYMLGKSIDGTNYPLHLVIDGDVDVR